MESVHLTVRTLPTISLYVPLNVNASCIVLRSLNGIRERCGSIKLNLRHIDKMRGHGRSHKAIWKLDKPIAYV